jgi:hypothetical protein
MRSSLLFDSTIDPLKRASRHPKQFVDSSEVVNEPASIPDLAVTQG